MPERAAVSVQCMSAQMGLLPPRDLKVPAVVLFAQRLIARVQRRRARA